MPKPTCGRTRAGKRPFAGTETPENVPPQAKNRGAGTETAEKLPVQAKTGGAGTETAENLPAQAKNRGAGLLLLCGRTKEEEIALIRTTPEKKRGLQCWASKAFSQAPF